MNIKPKEQNLFFPDLLIYMLVVVFLITGIISCTSNKTPRIPDYHTPEISMSWSGVYTGIIPAADCPGIDVQLTLNYNGTFALQYLYIDRGDSILIHQGLFTWDKTGSIVILDIENFPPYYMVAQGRLIQLDMQGKRITGDLADHYILEKILDESFE
jgi:uncharacterized lipoprotein NlpE involved in copper resistance